MIKLLKATANEVILTLTEKVTLSSPYFLFEFINSESKEKKYCIAADTSAYPERYNKFTITEKTSPTPTSGEVTLSLPGFWHYNVYEQSSSSNLDPDSATGVVETGISKVFGDVADYDTYDSQPKTYTVYTPS